MLIGLTGSFGAGKGVVADYLVAQKGFAHFSARTLLIEEIIERGLTVDRDAMATVANELRTQHGPSYILEQLCLRAQQSGGNAVVESLRAVKEVEYVQSIGGIVVGVDADQETRYKRIVERGSVTDRISFEKWREQEEVESNTTDPTKQNIFGALEASDYIIQNDGSLEELHTQIDDMLKKIAS
ncbi:MAG: AAA family ATPase [Candidatus Pacebacteria bacterium]|nr:AAA family ATPase [Candidatus Paceibacterota bacterium]